MWIGHLIRNNEWITTIIEEKPEESQDEEDLGSHI